VEVTSWKIFILFLFVEQTGIPLNSMMWALSGSGCSTCLSKPHVKMSFHAI